MKAKKTLGQKIVARYHSPEKAAAAREDWDTKFSKRDLESADLPAFTPAPESDLVKLVVAGYADCFETKRSNSEARRLIQQGSIQLNGEKLSGAAERTLPVYQTSVDGDILTILLTH